MCLYKAGMPLGFLEGLHTVERFNGGDSNHRKLDTPRNSTRPISWAECFSCLLQYIHASFCKFITVLLYLFVKNLKIFCHIIFQSIIRLRMACISFLKVQKKLHPWSAFSKTSMVHRRQFHSKIFFRSRLRANIDSRPDLKNFRHLFNFSLTLTHSGYLRLYQGHLWPSGKLSERGI